MNVFILSKCPLACVPKYTRKTLIPKLIKRETSPENEIKPNSKVHNYFYFYSFLLSKPTRAERWIWEDFHSFPKKSNISSAILSGPECLGTKLNREAFLSFYIPHNLQSTSQYSKVLWTVWSAHQTFLLMALDHHKS